MQLKNDYSKRAKALQEWIDNKNKTFHNRDFPNSIEGVQAKLAEHKVFKQKEKTEKSEEKVNLEAQFNALQTKLSVNKRPPFVPAPGLSPKDINDTWHGLEKSEHEYNLALLAELRRQKKIKDLLRRFNQKLSKLEAWITEKEK